MPKNIHLIAEQYTSEQVERARRFLEAMDSPAPEAAIALDIVTKVENYLVERSTTQATLFDLNNDALYKKGGMLL